MLLLAAYMGALVIGGGLLVVSAVLGGNDHDHDFDHDVDHDVDHDADHDAADHDAALAHVSASDALWLPIFSIRFWTFFLAFFGLTGLTLEGMRAIGLIGAPWGVALGLAVVMGAVAGYVVSRIIRSLKQEHVSSAVVPEVDYAGKAGEVLLDVAPGDPGLVRMDVKGVSIDVPAVAVDGDAPRMKRGSKVIVLSFKDGKVVVAPFETGERDGASERARESA
jgi:hypothetical protein